MHEVAVVVVVAAPEVAVDAAAPEVEFSELNCGFQSTLKSKSPNQSIFWQMGDSM